MISILIIICFFIWLSGVMDALTWYENNWVDENGEFVAEKSIQKKIFDVVFWVKEPWLNWNYGFDWFIFLKNVYLNISEFVKNAKN